MAVGVAAEVKSKLTILEVVGETVQLKKAGTTYKGLCPFHGEKTASFVVTPARETWHCFGCQEGGDIFSFVMKVDSITFPEALKKLAARAGIQIDERTTREDAHKGRLREVLENSIAFYHVVLTQSKVGAPALEYLHKRGFTDDTIEKFQLGWAPNGWDQMIKMLQSRRNVTLPELAEVGLTSPRANGRGAYDKFRARIIFPIRDAAGAAVGIGGRICRRRRLGRQGRPRVPRPRRRGVPAPPARRRRPRPRTAARPNTSTRLRPRSSTRAAPSI